VPEAAKPGDKLVLTRVHQVDDAGVCETSDWQCNVVGEPPSARDLSPAPSTSEIAPAEVPQVDVERLKQERQQFLEWGESLMKEVHILEKEKAELQTAQEQSRQRCLELERLVRQGVAQSGAAVATAEENEDLRKQLSAYAVEIDVVREERDKLQRDLGQTRETIRKLTIERDEALSQNAQKFTIGPEETLPANTVSSQEVSPAPEADHKVEYEARGGFSQDVSATPDAPKDPPAFGSKGSCEATADLTIEVGSSVQDSPEPSPEAGSAAGAMAGSAAAGAMESGEFCPQNLSSKLRGVVSFDGEDSASATGISDQLDGADSTSKSSKKEEDMRLCIGELKEALAKLQEGYVEQTQSYTSFASKVKKEQRQAQKEIQDARQMHLTVLNEFRAHLSESKWFNQVDFAAKTRALAAETEASIKKHQSSLEFSDEELIRLQKEHGQLQAELKSKEAELEQQKGVYEAELGEFRRPRIERNMKRDQKLAMPRDYHVYMRELQLNVAWEMASAQQGFVLEKVADGDKTSCIAKRSAVESGAPSQQCFVALLPSDMQVKWTKATGHEKFTSEIRKEKRQRLSPEKRRKLQLQKLPLLPDFHPQCREGRFGYWSSTLDLYQVVRIDYGMMNRACVRSDEDPWLCFSLVTLKQSYDFVCPDEDCAQCWVLAISRLAPWASGAIRSRGQFMSKKAWCKLESHCQQEEITIPQAVTQAIQATTGLQAGRTSMETRAGK